MTKHDRRLRNLASSIIFATLLTAANVQGDSAVQDSRGLPTGLWADATAETIGGTGEWTNKVELADLNGDGWVDILFANGGNYREPGEPVLSRIFLNQGPGKPFKESTEEIFGSERMLVRVIKAADVNGDVSRAEQE